MGLICESGLDVDFTAETASIKDKSGAELCHFTRKNGLYVTTVRFKNPAYKGAPGTVVEQGFQRQGS